MNGAKEKPRESLWSVSAARLPYYLVVYAVIVGVVTVMAMAAATGTLREAIFSAAPRIAAAGAAAVTILTCWRVSSWERQNCCSNGLGRKAESKAAGKGGRKGGRRAESKAESKAGRKSPTVGRLGTRRIRAGANISPCKRTQSSRSA